ncbi:MAG: response regulator [Chitinophagaceae bacterium]|nr:response regulator [Oligoflexus sp.]
MKTTFDGSEFAVSQHGGLFFGSHKSRALTLFLQFDWSSTELGPIDTWSLALKTTVNMLFSCPFPVMLWWGPGHIQIFNEAQRIVIGEREQYMGKPGRTCWPEVWSDTVEPDLNSIRATGEPRHYENRKIVLRQNGIMKETYWNYSFSPLFKEDGTIGGVLSISLETTGIIAAEKDLEGARRRERDHDRAESKSHEVKLRTITDRLPALISYMNINRRYQFVNQAYVDWFGLSREAIEGKTRQELVADASLYEYMAPYVERAFAGEAVSFEVTLYKPNGEYVNLDTEYLPDIDPVTQEVRGIVGVGHNITERKKALIASRLAQRDLARAKEIAETANATKSAFLANMSHEIRTPLSAILGFSEFLKDESLKPELREHFIQTIARNGQALTCIIDDILDLAKVEAGRLEVEELDFSFFQLLSEVVEIFRVKAQEKGISLSTIIDEGVTDFIASDPTRIRQILINIIGNAIKFTEKGGVSLSVHSSAEGDSASRIFVHVKDTGRGLTDEQKNRLFEPFMQADNTTTRQFGGTGLGLALSKRLSQALGGDIFIGECEVGKGSQFTITFRAGKARQPLDSLRQNRGITTASLHPPMLDAMKVLVVDDSPDNQFLLSRLLTKNGALVEIASDGVEAVEKASRHGSNFDVVLMDIQMPRMDGYEALRVLRSQSYPVPVVAVTAHAMKEDRLKTEAAGFRGHLTKPLNAAELLHCLQKWAR